MARRRSWFTVVASLAIAVLAVGVAVTLMSPGEDGPGAGPNGPTASGPAPPCPFEYVDRPGAAARIEQRLRGTEAGRALLDRLGGTEVRYCLGERAVSVVTEGRVLLIDERLSEDERAARAGHLLHHVAHGMPFPAQIPADADCDALVAEAVSAEAAAHALELRLRRAFELRAPRYDFEAAFWAAGGDEAVIADWLRTHPDGGRNVDALVSGYRLRCETERAQAGGG